MALQICQYGLVTIIATVKAYTISMQAYLRINYEVMVIAGMQSYYY